MQERSGRCQVRTANTTASEIAPLSPPSKARNAARLRLHEHSLLERLNSCKGRFTDHDFDNGAIDAASTALRLGKQGDGLVALLSAFRGFRPRLASTGTVNFQVVFLAADILRPTNI